jgi:hypothetical protein
MIRNEAECQEASKRLGEGTERPEQHGTRLKEAGLDEDEIKRVIDPLASFHLQLREEVDAYERLKRGEFDKPDNFRYLGHLPIASQIARGLTRRELARRLGGHETQVSRDERRILRHHAGARRQDLGCLRRQAAEPGRDRAASTVSCRPCLLINTAR